jgi:hypothetical protein
MLYGRIALTARTIAFIGIAVLPANGRDAPSAGHSCGDLNVLDTLGVTDDDLRTALKSASKDPKYARLKKLADFIEACAAARAKQTLPGKNLSTSNVAGAVSSHSAATPLPKMQPGTAAQPTDTQFRFLLRQDFTDVSIIAVPGPTDKSGATGASLGYSNDKSAFNKQWTAQGTAIAGYSFSNGYGSDNTVNMRPRSEYTLA